MPDLDPLAAVQHWFSRRTLPELSVTPHDVAAVRGETTIAVVLPARNEAATVGRIVEELRVGLQEKADVVDDIVVVDSRSSDATARVAAEAGARVVSDTDVLDQGKGGAMRRGLAATDADLVVYLDADVETSLVDYVTSLVTPLLDDPTLTLVKGYYDRPFTGSGVRPAATGGRPSGGGRVTELVARPLILERAPLLAGFAQPLAGECAVRRADLLTVPFISGYGVDIGLLLGVLDRRGLDAMAQVDLGQRIHRHQPIGALGRMALQVRAAFDLCLGGRDEIVESHVGFGRDADDALILDATPVLTRKLPPLLS